MPTTPLHALPYPAPADPADVPADMGELAVAIDSLLLPADTVAAAGTRLIANLLAAGNAQPAFRIMGNGELEWGPGGATAPDTNLYRIAPAVLQVDGRLISARAAAGDTAFQTKIGANAVFSVMADGILYWAPAAGGSADTNLYRSAANVLRTDDALRAAGGFYVDAATGSIALRATQASGSGLLQNELAAGDANPAFRVLGSGRLDWGPGGATAPDTNLYRSAVGVLKTDDQFHVGQDLSGGLLTGNFALQSSGGTAGTDRIIRLITYDAGNAARVVFQGTGNKIGFYGITPVIRQTISGSRAGNAALASLLTALNASGIVFDQTTA